MNKLFFHTNMSWRRVIILSLLCAIFSALMLIIPFTIHTSLSAPGTTFEFWIIMALIIMMNSNSSLDAGLKTFVFFLISQPLIYLLQVPFSHLGWGLFMFYPKWFILTLLTFPGAMIGYFVKKDNILSALILSVATAFLVYQGMYYIPYVLNRFPFYILSLLFCFGSAFGLGFILLKKRLNRIICLAITLCSFILLICIQIL